MQRQLSVMCGAIVASLVIPASVTIRGGGGQHNDPTNSQASSVAAAVRAAILRFADVNAAIADGYAQFQGCVSGPETGAMGVHFAKGDYFDGVVDLKHPEVLVYEPTANGGLRLVAAEYVVPSESWEPSHDDYDKPHLMGQLFHYAPSPNRYGGTPFYQLHVWAVKHNPRGTFADWNPSVSCDEWDGVVRQ